MPATLFYTGKSISVINSKLFGLKCLRAFLGGCNEDISVNILKFANITHYVELIYTYHTTTYRYLHFLGSRTLLLSLDPGRYIYTLTVHPRGVLLDRFVVPPMSVCCSPHF